MGDSLAIVTGKGFPDHEGNVTVPPFPDGVYLAPMGADLFRTFMGHCDGRTYSVKLPLVHGENTSALMAAVWFAVMLEMNPNLVFAGRLVGHEDVPDAADQFLALWAHGRPLAPLLPPMERGPGIPGPLVEVMDDIARGNDGR